MNLPSATKGKVLICVGPYTEKGTICIIFALFFRKAAREINGTWTMVVQNV